MSFDARDEGIEEGRDSHTGISSSNLGRDRLVVYEGGSLVLAYEEGSRKINKRKINEDWTPLFKLQRV